MSSSSYAFTPIPAARSSVPRRPAILQELSGFWRGQLMASDADVSTPFTFIRDASADASVAGRFLFFSTKDVPPTGVRLLEASQSAFVALVGPYWDSRENAEMVMILEGRRVAERMTGRFNTRFARSSRKGAEGRFVAVRQGAEVGAR